MARVKIGSLSFDAASGELVGSDATLRLEPKAAAVLAVLCEHRGAVVSRQMLLDRCWGDGEGSDEALTQAVAQVRKGLVRLGGADGSIETLAKRGYRLDATPEIEAGAKPQRSAAPGRARVLAWIGALAAAALVIGWVSNPHALRHFVRHSLGLGPAAGIQHR